MLAEANVVGVESEFPDAIEAECVHEKGGSVSDLKNTIIANVSRRIGFQSAKTVC